MTNTTDHAAGPAGPPAQGVSPRVPAPTGGSAPTATLAPVEETNTFSLCSVAPPPVEWNTVLAKASPLRIWPPQWMLARKRPEGMVAQVITPFEVTASFKSDARVQAVRVSDSAGQMDVPVERK